MDDLLTIVEKNDALPSVTTNFNALREEGTAYIAQLGHNLWTDFNVHDPGITILEVLCFAINDLGFRTDLPIEDLLASDTPSKDKKQFFSAAEILTCNPITPLDFRKLLIDVDGVQNAWLFKGKMEMEVEGVPIKLNGLYDICLELDKKINPTNKLLVAEVKERVLQKLCTYRNLGEDVLSIEVVGQKPICIHADILATPGVDVNEMQAQIIYKIESYLSFCPQFYSLEELLDKGKTCEEIFQGTILENGFLDDDELAKARLRRVIYKSDLYQIIMDVEGVEAISSLAINLCQEADIASNYTNEWCLDICQEEQKKADDEGEKYQQKIICKHKAVLNRTDSSISIKRGGISLLTNPQQVAEKLLLLEQLNEKPPIHSPLDQVIPKGTYRGLKEYFSIQEDFPLVYRVGNNQIPSNFNPKRIALVQQLKGFLTFFDQILANYLGQLAGIKDLFSVSSSSDDQGLLIKSLKGLDPGIDALFFNWYQVSQATLDNLKTSLREPDFQKLKTLQSHPIVSEKVFQEKLEAVFGAEKEIIEKVLAQSLVEDYDQTYLTEITENPLERHKRRNKMLNHLIARFGETFTDYALSLYPVCAEDACKASDITLQDTLLECKTDFLKNIPILGRERGKAFNYKGQDCLKKELFWNSENVAGLKKRVNKLLCLKESKRVQLSCEPQLVVVKDTDEQRKSFTWVIIEKGKNPANPDTQIYLRGRKEYTIRAKGKKDQEKIHSSLLASQALFNKEAHLEIEQDDTTQRFYLRLKTSTQILAESAAFLEEAAVIDLKEQLLQLLFPSNCKTEGFHIIEHILLRPSSTRKDITVLQPIPLEGNCTLQDPYSFYISIFALASWNRCQEENGTRTFFEQLVRRETPAHIGIHFWWLSGQEMYHFELAYKNWLYDLARPLGDDCQIEESQNKFIDLLHHIFKTKKEG